MRGGGALKPTRSQLWTDVRETFGEAQGRRRSPGVISHLLHNDPSYGFATVLGGGVGGSSSYGMRTAQPYLGRGDLPVLSRNAHPSCWRGKLATGWRIGKEVFILD